MRHVTSIAVTIFIDISTKCRDETKKLLVFRM